MTALNTSIVPSLISLFETLFTTPMTDEGARIRDVLSQLDTQLFDSYTKPHVSRISSTIEAGIFSPAWAPDTPRGKSMADRDPSPYVFTILLDLVIVHTELSTTLPSLSSGSPASPSPILSRTLRSLFESTVTSLINTFQTLKSCNLSALVQATLDVEFLSQTLSTYTTEKASKIQTDIYQVLDGKTGNSERVALQECLGDLRGVLKRLREGTRTEFACFRRPRRAEGR
jgi:exocyst complex component 2